MSEAFLVHALAALGQPIRLSLYRLLVEAGEEGRGPGALATAVGIPRNLVSYHLQPLLGASLLMNERSGRDVIYRVEPSGIERLVAALLALAVPGSYSKSDASL